jgi:hypothetical protein
MFMLVNRTSHGLPTRLLESPTPIDRLRYMVSLTEEHLSWIHEIEIPVIPLPAVINMTVSIRRELSSSWHLSYAAHNSAGIDGSHGERNSTQYRGACSNYQSDNKNASFHTGGKHFPETGTISIVNVSVSFINGEKHTMRKANLSTNMSLHPDQQLTPFTGLTMVDGPVQQLSTNIM